ncbi:putative transcriptional regulatory protein ZraR [Variovorax paradoxus B4]|uniref:Putative transcriptional regulatory protein ZraR n=1 Tax=Variovorax paradoxus B4 TaxID=1246301 RepID=T1XKP5_VARPD|nr:sigma-54 dependent transcriptional regulator [Variovorax paradoxus]AGU53153.1 putative transcriptional regulatory protein ZraR [Variovorax paradoxus B4]
MNRIVVADDDAGIARILSDRLRDAGHEVDVARDGVEALRMAEGADLLLLDLEMPRMDGLTVLDSLRSLPAAPLVIVITAHGDMAKAVRAMRAGAYDFIAKPFDSTTIQLVVRRALETRRLKAHVHSLRSELGRKHLWVRGSDPAMARIADTVERVAPSNATVLLLGETGTGKEVIARALHLQSNRGDQPFLAVNCALLKGELLESELFGHEKGAFTGADRARTGRVETARGGTLFLDEIGEMPPPLQAKLLRLLQEKEYERLGSDRTLKADVRVIAATHRDLGAAIREGSFREDLYYRLKVISIRIPPLRERAGDILPLAEWLLEQHAAEAGRTIPKLTEEVRQAVLRYGWPGNVRELSNVMQRCALLAGDTVSLFDLSEELVGGAFSDATPVTSTEELFDLPYNEAVAAARRLILQRALERSGGHQTRAAEQLGVTQPYLSRLAKQLGLRRDEP